MESQLEPGVRKLPAASTQAVDALFAQLDDDLKDDDGEEEEDLELWSALVRTRIESSRSVRSAWLMMPRVNAAQENRAPG